MTSSSDSTATKYRNIRSGIANYIFWFAIAYLCLYKLWMVSSMPFFVPMFFPVDDTWFFKKALSISAGGWFGEVYNSHTLIKMPVYSLFLSGIAQLGIHPKLAIDLLYIGASLIFVFAIKTFLHSRLAVFLAFAIVLFNPVTLSDYWITLLRLNLFIPLILVYLSALIALIVKASDKQHPSFSLAWGMLCASSLTLAWYTREEAIWMISALAPIVIISGFCLMRRALRIRIAIFWLMVVLMPVLLGQYFSKINLQRYGFDGVIDTRAPQFSRAFNAILSLNTANSAYPIYMTLETRDKLKTISESTRGLIEKMLDPGTGEYQHYGRNIQGNHASWEVRQAMEQNGYYTDATATEAAYKRIADDIEAYCQNTADGCRAMYISGVLVKPVSLERIAQEIKSSSINLINFSYVEPSDRYLQLNARKTKYIRGDHRFEYTVNRFFNFNSSWNPELDKRMKMPLFERNKNKARVSFFIHYQQRFFIFFAIAILGLAIALFNRESTPKLIALLLLGACGGSYSVYMLISLFAVPGFERLLAATSISLIAFTSFFFAYFIQKIIDLPGRFQL